MAHKAIIRRGSNPRCGDDIEVGFNINNDQVMDLQFRGRGCSVCLASTSMMTEAVQNMAIAEARRLATDMKQWVAGEERAIPEILQPLEAVRHHPARKKCVMLCWNALAEGLEEQ
jgi:nitrogen fixation NifU-like protein